MTKNNKALSTDQHPSAPSSLADHPSNGTTDNDAKSPHRGDEDKSKEVEAKRSVRMHYINKIKGSTLDDVEIVDSPTIPINRPPKIGTTHPRKTRLKRIMGFDIQDIQVDELRAFCARNRIYHWVYESNKDGNTAPTRKSMRRVKRDDMCEQIARYRAAYEIEKAKAKQGCVGEFVNLPIRVLAGPSPEDDSVIDGHAHDADDDNNVGHETLDQGGNPGPAGGIANAENNNDKPDDNDDDGSDDEAGGKKKSQKSSLNQEDVLQVGKLEENYRSLITFIDSRLDRIKQLKEQLYIAKSKTGRAADGRKQAKKALKRRREHIKNRKSSTAMNDSDSNFDDDDDDNSSQGSLVKEIVDCEGEVANLKKRKAIYEDNICSRLH